jgi:hypothetical protein
MKVLGAATRQPQNPESRETESRLNIAVVYTSLEATLGALKKAGALATRLSARITVLVPQIVPYPLPLTSPPVLLDFSEQRLLAMASKCPVDMTICIYLCRDRLETLAAALTPGTLVVIGYRRRWWPTKEEGLARKLRLLGHEVIVAETE